MGHSSFISDQEIGVGSLNPKFNTHKFIQSLQHQTNWVYEEV